MWMKMVIQQNPQAVKVQGAKEKRGVQVEMKVDGLQSKKTKLSCQCGQKPVAST
jgi:hypothetical protein